MRLDIEQMERELAGESVDNPVEIEGTQLPTRKRAVTQSAEHSPFARIRRSDLPKFSDRSHQELVEYRNKWQVELEGEGGLPPGSDHREAIRHAAKGLEGNALSKWTNWSKRHEVSSWDEYINFCKGCILDPANRKANAILELMTLKQRPGQKVQALERRVLELKEDVPPMAEEELEGWQFLNYLLDETREHILMHHKDNIKSREQVVGLAQRFEELGKAAQKSSSSTAHHSRGSRGAARPQSTRVPAAAPATPPTNPFHDRRSLLALQTSHPLALMLPRLPMLRGRSASSAAEKDIGRLFALRPIGHQKTAN